MANNGLTKNYNAAGTIAPYTIVKPGSNDYDVVAAAAATDKIIGVTTEVGAVSGEPCDVIHDGIADVKLGGTVTRGDLITSDANGNGVTAAPATGANARIVGIALVSGVAGDVIPVDIELGSMQG
jgi:hypothetical protein